MGDPAANIHNFPGIAIKFSALITPSPPPVNKAEQF